MKPQSASSMTRRTDFREAACGVRAESDKTPDVRLLFRHEGETFCPRREPGRQ